ncbi:metal dependent phosphohydrolase [Streptococcus virus MS1]|nr:metal dependent phosphohydrolase [Streptococcus virus MS1]
MTNVKRFKKIVTENIERDGIENLMEWLEHETDFFTAPASTRYHGSYEGGLVEHSLNVYDRLVWEMENTVGAGWQEIYSPEAVAIVALFHDLCKIDRYVITEKWRKDENGDWEAYEAYEYNKEKAEMGHGAQSVFYLQKFIQLTEFEAQAIFWHMGAYDISPYATLGACSETFKWNPLSFLTHRADMAATYVTENEAFVYGEGTDEEEVKVAEEKPAKKPARRGRKTVEKDPEPVDDDEEQEEEKPKPTRRRRKKEEPKEEPEVNDDDNEDEEEDPKPTRITRRKKTAPKDEPKEDAEEQDEDVEEKPKSSIRMPRKGARAAAKPVEPKTYYFYNQEDDYYYKKDENEPDDPSDILVDEEEYLNAMCPVLEEDFFYVLDGKANVLRKGERLPEEYDEETWEPITEAEYEEMVNPPKKTSVRASRKKPTPSKRPRP